MAKLADRIGPGMDQIGALAVAYSFSFVGAIIILIVGYFVAGLCERWTYRALGRIRGSDETLRRFLSKTLRYAILILVGVTVLAQFGVQTASIIATLGAAGLAVGLALQGTLQNVAAGIMLLVLKPFRVGEYIDTGTIAGTIVEVGLFATEMTRYDGLYIMAPNSQLWNTAIINYSRNRQRRNEITIGIGYGEDIALAQETLLDLATRDERVLKDPAPEAFVAALSAYTVNVTLRYWTTTADWWQANLDLTRLSKLAFDQKGITIPSQQDVRIYTETNPRPEQPQPRQLAAAAHKKRAPKS